MSLFSANKRPTTTFAVYHTYFWKFFVGQRSPCGTPIVISLNVAFVKAYRWKENSLHNNFLIWTHCKWLYFVFKFGVNSPVFQVSNMTKTRLMKMNNSIFTANLLQIFQTFISVFTIISKLRYVLHGLFWVGMCFRHRHWDCW